MIMTTQYEVLCADGKYRGGGASSFTQANEVAAWRDQDCGSCRPPYKHVVVKRDVGEWEPVSPPPVPADRTTHCVGCTRDLRIRGLRVTTKNTEGSRYIHGSDISFGYVDQADSRLTATEILIWLCPICKHPGAAPRG